VNLFSKIRSAVKDKDWASVTMPFLCRTILLIIVIGVALRIILGFFVTFVFDVYHWGVVIQNINSGNGLYEMTGYFYTPPWGYILGLEAFLQDIFGLANIGERITDAFLLESIDGFFVATVTTIAFGMSIKLLFLLCDIVVGYLIFWIIRDLTKDKRKAILGFALWFLCPFVMTVGAIIVQFDTISVMITLLAVIMLRKERYIESGVLLCLATLLKLFPGFFVFLFIAHILSKHREDGTATKKLIMFFVSIAVTAFIIFLPQLLDGTIASAFSFITSRVSDGVGTSAIAAIGGYVAILAYIAAAIVSILLALRIKNNTDKERSDSMLFDALLVTTAVLFLYPPLPQYVLLLLPFVIFAFMKDARYKLPLILLMIGTTIVTIAGGPMNLAALAAYTDLIDMGSVMGMVRAVNSTFLGFTTIQIFGFIGYAIQYIGILSVLWIRFGERIKETVRKITHKENTAKQ